MKKRHLISIEKIHAIKNIYTRKKKIQLKNGSFQLNEFMSSRHYQTRLGSV